MKLCLSPVLPVLVVACSNSAPRPATSAPPATTVESGGAPPGLAASGYTPDGKLVLLDVERGVIAKVSEGSSPSTFVWPPVVDSHVHLAFAPVGDKLAARGVGAVVDLAAPLRELPVLAAAPITVIAAGPMLTSPQGYPLNAWGADGYGIGCADKACVGKTIDELAAAGAKLIKLPLDRPGGLAMELVAPAVDHAHAKGLRVAVHALTNEAAYRGGIAGADILAHTPVEPLAEKTVLAWKGRAVVTTLIAFGGRPSTVNNLRLLRAAGLTVLYGTDLGNAQVEGPSADEMQLMRDAGMDDAAIVDAMTTVPIAFWQLPFGFEAQREASFFVLSSDPRKNAAVLLKPSAVFSRGRVVK